MHWGEGARSLVSFEEAGRAHLRIAFPRTGLDTDPLTSFPHWLATTSGDIKIPDPELPCVGMQFPWLWKNTKWEDTVPTTAAAELQAG